MQNLFRSFQLQLALSVLSLLGLARVRMQPCWRRRRRPVLIFFFDHLERFFFRRPPGPPKGPAPPTSSSLSAASGLSRARRLRGGGDSILRFVWGKKP